jgi:hypothetical protein
LLLFLIVKSFYSKDIILAQENCKCTIINDPNQNDYTEIFQQNIDTCSVLKVSKGNFNISRSLMINKSIRILGDDNAHLFFKDTISNRDKPKGLFEVSNLVDLEVNNLEATGKNNYLISYLFTQNLFESGPRITINITENDVKGLGLIWVAPKAGFTYNRLYGNNYYQKGGITGSLKFKECNILNNSLNGGYFYDDVLKKKISAIALLYCSNVFVKGNEINNYRFGIWVYGGSSFDKSTKRFPTNPIFVENILIKENRLINTYSSIFLSRSKNILIENNYSKNTLDVSFDLEGCSDAIIRKNESIDANGGSFTLLNNSENILVQNNLATNSENKSKLRMKRVVFIRNNNKQNRYISNYFEYLGSNIGEIRIDNRLINDKTHKIEFAGNVLKNLKIVYVK